MVHAVPHRLFAWTVLGIVAIASSVHAAADQQLLTSAQAGGWSATAPDGANVGLQVLGIVNDTLYIKKHAVFHDRADGGIDPIPIAFSTDGQTGIHRIVIDSEEIGNESSRDLNGFVFVLLNAAFDHDSAIGFDTHPFGTRTLDPGNKVLTMTGGLLKTGESFFPGFGKTGGDLVILASGDFSLVENAGGPSGEPVVALPSAFWTGASALGVLAMIQCAKAIRTRLG